MHQNLFGHLGVIVHVAVEQFNELALVRHSFLAPPDVRPVRSPYRSIGRGLGERSAERNGVIPSLRHGREARAI